MAPHSKTSLVLLSGGLDSTAALATLVAEGQRCEALFIAYGQKSEARERDASRNIAAHYGVGWRELEMRWIAGLGKSALTEPLRNLPMLDVSDLDDAETVRSSGRSVWVPNRNAVFAMAAAAIAEAEQMASIALGFNLEEAQTFPDNSPEFLEALQRVLALSTQTRVGVVSPTLNWTKTEMVARMKALSGRPGVRAFPWDLVWSCYAGGEIHCGRCESCCRMERALRAAAGGAE